MNAAPGGRAFQTLGWGNQLTELGTTTPSGANNTVAAPPSQGGMYAGGGGGESVYFAKPAWQANLPGTGRQTPDVSALGDNFTGVCVVLTGGGEHHISCGNGGTSLSTPIFSGIWAIAQQMAGAPLGQAAPLIALLPKNAIQDVVPHAPVGVNPSAIIQPDSTNVWHYSSNSFFPDGVDYTSVVWADTLGGDETDYKLFTFDDDGALKVTEGWDNVTGFGTPNGLPFFEGVAQIVNQTR